MSTLPLDGVRVLDLSRILAGPFCTMQLADLGAEVFKVEPPGGDDTRRFAPPWVEGEDGEREASYFLAVNRGKRSLCLDLKKPEARAIVHRLAHECDVVVENFRTGVTERLEVDAKTLRALNPRLVYVSISGFGRDGAAEWVRAPGYDLVIQGMGGLPSLTGPEEGPPYKVGGSIADICAGMTATQAVLAALLRRERTGEGGVVDVSMLEVQLSLLAYQASSWLMANVPPARLGNNHPSVHPYSTYRAKDGFLNVAVGNDTLFERLARVCERPGWLEDPRFASNPARVENREAMDAELEAALASDTAESWLERLREAGVPAGPVLDVPDALAHPQNAARGSLVTHEHPGLGPLRSVASPLLFPGLPRAHPQRPPRVGEHSREVLAEVLGLDGTELDALVASGAVPGA